MEMTLKMVLDERQWARHTHTRTHTYVRTNTQPYARWSVLQLIYNCIFAVHPKCFAYTINFKQTWRWRYGGTQQSTVLVVVVVIFSIFSRQFKRIAYTKMYVIEKPSAVETKKKHTTMYIWPLHNSLPIIASFQSNCGKTTQLLRFTNRKQILFAVFFFVFFF